MAAQAGNPPINFQTSKSERTAFGFYFFGQNVFYILILNFLQIFLTDQGITAAAVATIFLIAKVWDAINDPLFGVIIDRSKPKSGKFLPWVRGSVLPIAITTIMIFAMPVSMSLGGKIAWAAIAYLLWDLAYTLCDAPIFALTTAMTENIQERTVLISIGRLGGMFGALIIALGVPMLYPQFGWLPTAVGLAIVGVATMFPITGLAKERILSRKEEAPSLQAIWKYLKGNKYLLIFYASMVVYFLTNSTFTITPFFAVNNLGSAEAATTLLGITILPMVLLAGFTPALAKRFGKFNLYAFSIVWQIVFSVIVYFAGYENYNLLLALLLLRSIGVALAGILMFMFTPDCVEYGTFKTGERAEGVTFSLQTFATKLMNGLSATVAMAGLAYFGFVEGSGAVQSPETLNGIWLMYSIFPIVGALLSLPLLAMFKLRDDNVQVMAQANNGEITREEAFKRLPEEFHFK
ncbi:MAG TPA: MFS transporter [Anaerolineales bacterium]|jgi:sugar (glycoside-pentoside-hexuronide) transporter|nr:MFS transporter [Anaerolineales bacterium]HNA87692.1 MFS transporter [Anaerolineales bacterium]HNB34657.1 MFS transporter [Anaerolineales bacterium]HNJ11967.1 MFS transporter [Anaerolineales bacterium]